MGPGFGSWCWKKTLDCILALELCQGQLSLSGTERLFCDILFSIVPFSCGYGYNLRSPFSPFTIQVKPLPSSVTQRNKQPWHPDEDDEEFTANENEGQAYSLYPVIPYPSDLGFLTFSTGLCLCLCRHWSCFILFSSGGWRGYHSSWRAVGRGGGSCNGAERVGSRRWHSVDILSIHFGVLCRVPGIKGWIRQFLLSLEEL